jgi:hypothetical protein
MVSGVLAKAGVKGLGSRPSSLISEDRSPYLNEAKKRERKPRIYVTNLY